MLFFVFELSDLLTPVYALIKEFCSVCAAPASSVELLLLVVAVGSLVLVSAIQVIPFFLFSTKRNECLIPLGLPGFLHSLADN